MSEKEIKGDPVTDNEGNLAQDGIYYMDNGDKLTVIKGVLKNKENKNMSKIIEINFENDKVMTFNDIRFIDVGDLLERDNTGLLHLKRNDHEDIIINLDKVSYIEIKERQ